MKLIKKGLWKLFGGILSKELAQTQNKVYNYSSLPFRFADSHGTKYYGYSSDLELPVVRYTALMKYATAMSHGVSKEVLHTTITEADKLMQDGVANYKKGKRMNLIKLAAIISNLKKNDDAVRPEELIYNIICCQLIREDENPELFNDQIHMEKVQACKEELNTGNSFFLQTLEYSKVIEYSTMSIPEWKTYLKTSREVNKAEVQAIRNLKDL